MVEIVSRRGKKLGTCEPERGATALGIPQTRYQQRTLDLLGGGKKRSHGLYKTTMVEDTGPEPLSDTEITARKRALEASKN